VVLYAVRRCLIERVPVSGSERGLNRGETAEERATTTTTTTITVAKDGGATKRAACSVLFLRGMYVCSRM
jgi:hypothetical protein